MRIHLLAAPFVFLLIASVSGSAPPPEPMAVNILTGTPHTLAISGENGESITTRRPGDDAILVGMLMAERRDYPCQFDLDWWRHNSARSTDADSQGNVETTLSFCDPADLSFGGVRVGANNNQTVPYQYGDMYYAAHGI